MATEDDSATPLRSERDARRLPEWVHRHSSELTIGYPLVLLAIFFIIPLCFLVVVSFFPKPSGGYYSFGFTLSHYRRFFTTPLYLQRLGFTLALGTGTATACLAIGYPIAYSLSRMESSLRRRTYITIIVSTMWLTYIIRSYAWGVILSESGILNRFLMSLNIVQGPVVSSPGLLAVSIGMVYVFLPFAILSVYSSIDNINRELEEASLNLGANRLQTFRKITLPLSKNGIYAGWMLVFILALGSYIIPRILGTPSQWTLPVIIAEQVLMNLNVPFGAAMALVMMVIVVSLMAVGYKFFGLSSQDLAGNDGDAE